MVGWLTGVVLFMSSRIDKSDVTCKSRFVYISKLVVVCRGSVLLRCVSGLRRRPRWKCDQAEIGLLGYVDNVIPASLGRMLVR